MYGNGSYTYFCIVGDYKTEDVLKLLDMESIEKWDIGDEDEYDEKLDCAEIRLVESKEDTLILEEQAQEIVALLKPKIPVLQKILSKFDIQYFLEIVGYFGEDGIPAITFGEDVLEFCYLTKTVIECDLYDLDS